MKNKITLIIVSFLACFTSLAQTFILYGDKAFGSDKIELPSNFLTLDSGRFLISGYSNGNISGDKTDPKCDSTLFNNTDNWIIVIDTAFNVVWDKSYGGSRSENGAKLIKKKNSNEFILACPSTSDSSCEKTSQTKSNPAADDYWVLTIDAHGNKVNDWSWGGLNSDWFPEIIELSSGNYIICGTSLSPLSGDKTVSNFADSTGYNYEDYWIIKTDSSGNKLWDKVYGGSRREFSSSLVYHYGFKILAENNDDFILAGTTDSPLSGTISDSSRGKNDIWVIKIDSAGDKVWDKRYGGSGDDQCDFIMHTDDSGYMIGGYTASPQGGEVSDTSRGLSDCWILKLDSVGNKQWDKRYGGNRSDYATWIEKAPGGGYWVSGTTISDSTGDVTEPKYSSMGDFWIFKIDETGTKLWDKRFGGPGNNFGSTFNIMPDGSIFLLGQSGAGTSAVKTDSGKGLTDYWIVHFKYTDSLSTSGINNSINFNKNLIVFPNPTSDLLTITSATENIKSVALINLFGEIMFTQEVNNARSTKLNLQAYPPGFYFVKITGANYSVIKKVIRQ